MKKEMTSKEIIHDINKKIEGLTHDIKTLEAMAKQFLTCAMDVKELKQALYSKKHDIKCKYEPYSCNHTCELKELIERDSR